MFVPALRSLFLTALLALPLAAANDAIQNGESKEFPKAHNEWTIVQLENAMAAGTLTSEALTKEYINRILAIDQNGPGVNALLEINPDALNEARYADVLRKHGIILGPMHGIPVLLKGNIDTGDKMQTSAGSLP